MKKRSFLIGCDFLVIILAGCAPLKSVMRIAPSVNKAVSIAPLPSYSGPKAKIAVTDFAVKATKTSDEIASGLREMLLATLINSNRFSVIEHQTGGADLIITAAVTEFKPEGSGGRAGIGGGGGAGSGRLGGLLGTSLNKAHMALDMRIVDTSTSGVLAAGRVQGQASDTNTPMEKAIQACIIEAVRYIVKVIPANYYKY